MSPATFSEFEEIQLPNLKCRVARHVIWRPPSTAIPLELILYQPFIRSNDVKWRSTGQRAAAVLNCAAQADIMRASTLRRVVR